MYVRLEINRATLRGLGFLDKNKNMLNVTASNIVSTNAGKTTTANTYPTDADFNAILQPSAVSYPAPRTLTDNENLYYEVDLSDFKDKVRYIRVLNAGSNSAIGTWGATINLYTSEDGVNWNLLEDSKNFLMNGVSFYAFDFKIHESNMTLKNPITNQHYSLAEKTLIPLPNTSSKNMILHGVETGKEIQLDEAFDKIQYINELSTATQGTSGKIVTQKLLESINKIVKISEVR